MKPPGAQAARGAAAVDLLVSVVVIALLVAWLLPQITGSNGAPGAAEAPITAADSAKDASNARNIAAMTQAIAAMGGRLPASKEEILDALVAGTNVPFAGGSTHYQLSGLGPDDLAAAAPYLEFENNRLVFRPRP